MRHRVMLLLLPALFLHRRAATTDDCRAQAKAVSASLHLSLLARLKPWGFLACKELFSFQQLASDP